MGKSIVGERLVMKGKLKCSHCFFLSPMCMPPKCNINELRRILLNQISYLTFEKRMLLDTMAPAKFDTLPNRSEILAVAAK